MDNILDYLFPPTTNSHSLTERYIKHKNILTILALFGVSNYSLIAQLLNKDPSTISTTLKEMENKIGVVEREGKYYRLSKNGQYIASLILLRTPNNLDVHSSQLNHVLGIQESLIDVLWRYQIPDIGAWQIQDIFTGSKKLAGKIYPDCLLETNAHYHWIEYDQKEKDKSIMEKNYFLKCSLLANNPALVMHHYCDEESAKFWREKLKNRSGTTRYQQNKSMVWQQAPAGTAKINFERSVKRRFRVLPYS